MTTTAPELDTATAVLDAVRSDRSVADAAESRILRAAVTWAAMHSTDSLDDAACDWFGDQPIPVAGPGAPLVAEFSIAEFATALGLPTEVGKAYVGEALELRHRLPKTWQRVVDGDLPAWRARRIARATLSLSLEAAAYVDAKIAAFAHKIRPTALDRLINVAIARFMPAEADACQRAAADGRHFDIDTRQHRLDGTATVYGTLDVADALDLESAVTETAGQLKDLGSEDSLDVRRAVAVGEIARHQLTLDLSGEGDGEGEGPLVEGSSLVEERAQPAKRSSRHPRHGRQVVLHVHLSAAAIAGAGGVGRLENLNIPVLEQQIRGWCGGAAQITVKPVIDLADCIPVEAYEVPDRMDEHVSLRDLHCVFPYCTRPPRQCDCDHVVPHNKGGPTCPCNLAPLCRRHHRIKTHGRWRYLVLKPGMYLWTSPHGYLYLRDHEGTADVSPDRRSRHDRCATSSTTEGPAEPDE